MSKFKGTKGRWKVCDKHKTILDEFGYGIAQIHGVLNEDKWEANAKLIACAPEMLETLEKLVVIFDNFVMPTEQNLKQYSAELKQLIKKATE